MGDRALSLDRDVLLFFGGRDRDTLFRGDRKLRKFLREVTAPLRGVLQPRKQQVTGYETSFALLRRALEGAGMRVHVDDFRLARRNPGYPVGVSGFEHIIEDWTLPNPAVLGPGLYDHPGRNPNLMRDPRFRAYLVKGAWMKQMFAPYYGEDRVRVFFSGMDLGGWPDTSASQKHLDFLVYDKIRWNRDRLEPSLLAPLLGELRRRNLRFEVLRYGAYRRGEYRRLLSRSRAMIFLCEHETQGMACQEALASNVPVLAWDQGFWLDPVRPRYEPSPVPASSVPNFSSACGERFREIGEFPETLERFITRLGDYAPRAWVRENLSMERSAELYLESYRGAARADRPAQAEEVTAGSAASEALSIERPRLEAR